MPSIEKRVKLSLERTGREYKEIHEWMDEEYRKPNIYPRRHDITNIPILLPVVERNFGKEGVKEYLYHIRDDYENNALLRFLRKLKKAKFW